MVNEAVDKQQETAAALKSAEEKYRSTVLDFETRISTLTTQHLAECTTLEQKYRSAVTSHESAMASSMQSLETQNSQYEQQQQQAKLDYDSSKAALESQYETMLSQLRLEILQGNMEADQLRSKIQALEAGEVSLDEISISPRSRTVPEPRKRRMKLGVLLAWVLVLILTSVLVAPVALVMAIRQDRFAQYANFFLEYNLPMEYLTLDSLCSPLRAGSRLVNTKAAQTWSAPWWATSELQDPAFSFVCQLNRPRIRLTLERGKLSAHDERETLLWKESAQEVLVDSDDLVLLDKRGRILQRIAMPWVSPKNGSD